MVNNKTRGMIRDGYELHSSNIDYYTVACDEGLCTLCNTIGKVAYIFKNNLSVLKICSICADQIVEIQRDQIVEIRKEYERDG